MGSLYLVATPIGNREDITLRAKRVLAEVDLIACEDTRKTGNLLKLLGISSRPQLVSYYEENEGKRIPYLISLLQQGQDIALVSNAGTPTISDPGYKLVRTCLEQGIKVIPIPGPSAILAALVASGLPTDKFVFLGYLPKKQGKRQKVLSSCLQLPFAATIIVYESPYRLIKTLADIKEVLGDIDLVIASELTKKFENIEKRSVSNWQEEFAKRKPQGEYTLVFNITS